MGELVDAVNNLTINDAKYYGSSTETTSGVQGDLTSNPETVAHTSNGIFKQKILSCQTIPVFPPTTNPGTAAIMLVPQMLLMPETK